MTHPPFAAYDYLTCPVSVLDRERRIVYANPAMRKFAGDQEESLLGAPCHQICHHASLPCAGDQVASPCVFDQVLATGLPAISTHAHPNPAGGEIFCEVTASPIVDAAGAITHVLYLLRDVSEREQAKRQLENRCRLDAAIAALSHAVIVGCEMEGIAHQVMEQAQQLTASQHAFAGSLAADGGLALSSTTANAWTRDGKDDPQAVLVKLPNRGLYGWVQKTGQAILTNDPTSDPRSVGSPPGHFTVRRFLSVPVKIDGEVLGQIAVANAQRDYTEDDLRVMERLAELFALFLQHHTHDQKILYAKQEWEKTFDSIGDVICLLDSALRIVRVNKAGAALLGKTPAELVGSPCHVLFQDGDGPCLGCPMVEVWADSASHFAVVENKKLDKIFEVSISPIFGDQGVPSGYVHFAKDITGVKKLELQLREALKMEAVGRLAGGVAHDFNNILTVITGYLSITMRQLPADSPVRDALTEVDKASRRAANLVRQLLLFSRRQPMRFAAFDLNSSLQDLLKMLRRFIGENVQLELRLGSGLWPIQGDAGNIDQIVMNLAVNARDAMPDGGTLVIETQNVEVDDDFCQEVLNAVPGRFVRLSIADTGCGMDHTTMQHIYEPFYTTKESGKGTGLGLAVVYGIVVEHRGWITCSSRPGQGTTFQVYLPVAQSGTGSGGIAGAADMSTLQGRGERVLVVEDDETILTYTAMMLRGNGYQVSTAKSLAEAQALVEGQEPPFDLLFSDVVLPDGYGPELASQLLHRHPGLGVAMTSGYPERYGKWPEEGGAWPFVQKPYDAPSLLAALRQALAVRQRR